MIIQEILQNIVGKKYSVNKLYCFRTIHEQNKKKRYPASVSEDIRDNCVKTDIVGNNYGGLYEGLSFSTVSQNLWNKVSSKFISRKWVMLTLSYEGHRVRPLWCLTWLETSPHHSPCFVFLCLIEGLALLIACLYEVVWIFPCLRPSLQLPAFCGCMDLVSRISNFFASDLCVPACLNCLPFMACLSHLVLLRYLPRLVSSASLPMLLSLAYLACNSDCLPLKYLNTWPQLHAWLRLSGLT